MTGALRAWWSRRAGRERVLVLAMAIVAGGAAVDALFLASQRTQASALQRQLTTSRIELDQLQALVARHAQVGDAQTQQRIEALQTRRLAAEAALRQVQSDLIAPQEMAAQLARVLDRFSRLRVIAATSLPPVPVLDQRADGQSIGGASAGLYQHGLEIQIEGRYLDLIAYLDALERTPHRIYWRELDLKVGPQGVPLTRIAIFTLSRESAWLRI